MVEIHHPWVFTFGLLGTYTFMACMLRIFYSFITLCCNIVLFIFFIFAQKTRHLMGYFLSKHLSKIIHFPFFEFLIISKYIVHAYENKIPIILILYSPIIKHLQTLNPLLSHIFP
uniref:Uncharacterized protein n=1 Tax=Opuntia streptacantha TaxID=393608 RepID=A0A7C9DMH6_OPUST